MPDWTDLEQSLRDAGRRKTEARRHAEARVEAERKLREWAFEVVPALMVKLAETSVLRARELARATGQVIDVSYPVQSVHRGSGEPFPLHVVALKLDDVQVDIYSAEGPGGLPALHVVSHLRGAARERRLVSEPGCLVSRRSGLAGDGYELLSLNPAGAPTTLDELVHRAFSRLVGQWASH